jgi:hypothetical protein
MTDRRCEVCGKPILYSGQAKDYVFKTRIDGVNHYFCGYNCQNAGEQMRVKIKIDPRPLKRARDTYGSKNQIAVCVEELAELIKVLAKYFRYDDVTAVEKLRQDALDETTDVYIILEHVKAIFNLRNGEINEHTEAKLERLSRWLNHSSDISYTMEDREVKQHEPEGV